MSRIQIAAAATAALILATPTAQAAPFEFAGFYAGAHFGYMESSADFGKVSRSGPIRDDLENGPQEVSLLSSDFLFVGSDGGGDISGGGLMGGLQAGYNMMFGNIMVGVETDISLTGANPDGACPNNSAAKCEVDLGPMATLRPRVGYAVDDFLFYATGGAAGSRIDTQTRGGGSSDENEQGIFGWTVGGGVEYLVGDIVGVKLEYRYLRFGDFDNIKAPSGAKIKIDTHTVMGGLNFHF